MTRRAAVAIIALLNAAVAFGNYVLGYVAALGCSAQDFGDEPTLCADGWGWPALLLPLPTVVALTGAVVSLVRRSFDAAVLGLIGAPVIALLAWVVAWSL